MTKYNLDFREFVRNGLPASVFPENDELAEAAIAAAEKRIAKEHKEQLASEELRVIFDDCQANEFCAFGIRRVLRKHNLSMRKFLDEGLPVSELPTGDPLVDAAIEQAERRTTHGRK